MAEDRFLSRWSRRKAKARSGRGLAEAERPAPTPPPTVADRSNLPVAAAEPAPDAAEETVIAAPVPEPTEEELDAEAAELGLPPLESLGEGSDFKAFMAKEVPARLRNRALRKLWISNPVLANLDGLVDYGEDFTNAATVVENMTTAYRVGQGYKKPDEEEVEETAREPSDAAPEDASEGRAEDASETLGDDPPEGAEASETAADEASEGPEDGEPERV